MVYFSNSGEGMWLDEQCCECIHEDETALCPIAEIQLMYNYDQVGNELAEKIMDKLISKGGCRMKPMIEKYYKKKPLDIDVVDEIKYKGEDWS